MTNREMNQLSDYSTNADECNACEAVRGQCPYHAGVEAGIEQARAALAQFAESA
jgi:hypothetical protein